MAVKWIIFVLMIGLVMMVACGGNNNPKVKMVTSMGDIYLELYPEVAPRHVENFLKLSKEGFYDGLMFHRVIDGFVIQGGCPNGDGTGGSGENVPAEFNDSIHRDGTLSMARAADENSASSQFFICLNRLESLDNKYTVFGQTVEGLDVVHAIGKTPTTGRRGTPPNRPEEPVYIKRIEIIKE